MNLPVSDGDVVGGKYVIEGLLGCGGMGAVFVASQSQLNRPVAIKFLLPEYASKPEALARFERETRAAAALRSEHATKVYDVGNLDSGLPYMVMELLEGEDLAAILAREGPLPTGQAIDVVVEACEAIAEAHSLGIIHRDLKPANLFLSRRPNGASTTKVLDFGVSKATKEVGAGLTTTSAVLGSALYMSPEQLRESRNIDGRADIWALGVTLYELLTGEPPFAAGAFAEVASKILVGAPEPPRSLRPDLPKALNDIILKCIHKDPARRFQTVDELVMALTAARPTSTAGTHSKFAGATNLEQASKPRDTRRWLVLASLCAAVALGTTLAFRRGHLTLGSPMDPSSALPSNVVPGTVPGTSHPSVANPVSAPSADTQSSAPPSGAVPSTSQPALSSSATARRPAGKTGTKPPAIRLDDCTKPGSQCWVRLNALLDKYGTSTATTASTPTTPSTTGSTATEPPEETSPPPQ